MDELAAEFGGRAKVGTVNCSDNFQTAGGFGIFAVPTILIFKEGKPVQQFQGLRSKEDLARALEDAVAA